MIKQIIHQEESLALGDYYSLIPPSGWEMDVSYARLPVRLSECGRMTFKPLGSEHIFLTCQIVNWLDGQTQWDVFRELLERPGDVNPTYLDSLYPILLAVQPKDITQAQVSDHPGIGPVLLIEYEVPEQSEKGQVIYASSPSGRADVFIASYEGKEPYYSAHLLKAQSVVDSLAKLPSAEGLEV